MRVLLAEDDNMIAQAVAANLKDSGYAVDWVKNGSQVSTALQAQNYDLLLLDLGLPGKDGLDVLTQIRHEGSQTPSSSLPPATTSTAASTDWTAAPTTTSSNPSTWRSCKPVCAPSCAATAATAKPY